MGFCRMRRMSLTDWETGVVDSVIFSRLVPPLLIFFLPFFSLVATMIPKPSTGYGGVFSFSFSVWIYFYLGFCVFWAVGGSEGKAKEVGFRLRVGGDWRMIPCTTTFSFSCIFGPALLGGRRFLSRGVLGVSEFRVSLGNGGKTVSRLSVCLSGSSFPHCHSPFFTA